MHCIVAGNAALKYLAGHRSIKVKENHYPSDDPETVADDRLTLAQEKLAYCVVMMADSGLKSAKKRKRLAYILQNKLPCINRAIKWQMPGTNIFTNLELFCSSHNHSICILSFINPLISMEYVIKNK